MVLPCQDWLQTIPSAFTNDPLWRMQVYRFALYLSDLVMEDSFIIAKTYHLNPLASQLYRATTSIDANISEGYSCLTKTEQSQFYRYAFRSAREARGWYFKARTLLGEETT
jgi:four helix bundle protein